VTRAVHNRRAHLGCTLVLALTACDRNGPQMATNAAGGAGLGIPYPVGEAERIEGWSRAALSRSSFAVVHSDAFARPVAVAGPTMVGLHVRDAPGLDTPFAALLELAFDGRRPLQPATAAVSAAALADLGYRRPTPSLFLIGAAGNCRAKVGAPTVTYYEADDGVLQIDWTLDGCDTEQAWAPVAVVADRLPPDTKWVEATVGLDAQFDADAGWQGPLAAALPAPQWRAEYDAGVEVVRILEIPGVQPTVVQVYDSLVRVATDDAHAALTARGLDPACADEHATAVSHGRWNGEIFDAFDPGPGRAPHLLGAFVRDGQIDGLVYDQSLNPLVAIPPAPTLDGESEWVLNTLTSAVHTRLAQDAWGYLPTSEPSPRGDPCDVPSD